MSDILAQFGPHRDLLYSSVIADVLDTLGHRTSALPALLRPLRSEWKLLGRVMTLAAQSVATEPERMYAVELECIDALKPGDVFVATTQGDYQSALWGELLSTAARAHGAVGAIIDGMTRDAAKIIAMDFPVFAAGCSPLDSKGRLDAIHYGRPVRIGSCAINPGDWVFADIDGVVIVPANRAERTFSGALEKATRENHVRRELAKGRSARDVFAEYGIL
jgi:regulator of RNase E activity RraA